MSTTPPLNLPSFRISYESQLAALPPEHQAAFRSTFNALTDIYQAIPQLKSQIDAVKTTATTTANTVASNTNTASETIIQQVAPVIGNVNNLTGVTAYTSVQSDYGSLLLFDDTSAVALTLSVTASLPGIVLPWYCMVQNTGGGAVTVTPTTGQINNSASITVADGSFAIIFFDGTNFWSGILASASAAGVSQIVAGTNISISPNSGVGVVTVNATTGAGGVSSLNTLTGALTLTSTGSSVTITPSGSTIDLEVTPGSGVYLKGSINIPYGGATSGTFSNTGTVTGAATTMGAIVCDNGSLDAFVQFSCYVSSANTVTLVATLPGGSVHYSSQNYNVIVFP